MVTVVSIVEGDGEVAALPVLLRRIGAWLSPGVVPNISYPIRVRRDQFLRRAEHFEKNLRLAALRCAPPGWILILLDADDDCPKDLAQDILARAARIAPGQAISVVLANREYEAWFVAAAESLDGKRGFVRKNDVVVDSDAIRNAKGWVSQHIAGGAYHEVDDQPAFSHWISLQQAHAGSRSFRKLCSEWAGQMAKATATPQP